MKKIFFVICFFVLQILVFASPIEVSQANKSVIDNAHIQYILTPNETSISSVVALQSKFSNIPQDGILGYTQNNVVWLHYQIINPGNSSFFVLAFNRPFMDNITIYQFDNGKLIKEHGITTKDKSKRTSHPYISTQLYLEHNTVYDIYIRIDSKFIVDINQVVYNSYLSFAMDNLKFQWVFFFISGAAFTLSVLMLTLFWAYKGEHFKRRLC